MMAIDFAPAAGTLDTGVWCAFGTVNADENAASTAQLNAEQSKFLLIIKLFLIPINYRRHVAAESVNCCDMSNYSYKEGLYLRMNASRTG